MDCFALFYFILILSSCSTSLTIITRLLEWYLVDAGQGILFVILSYVSVYMPWFECEMLVMGLQVWTLYTMKRANRALALILLLTVDITEPAALNSFYLNSEAMTMVSQNKPYLIKLLTLGDSIITTMQW